MNKWVEKWVLSKVGNQRNLRRLRAWMPVRQLWRVSDSQRAEFEHRKCWHRPDGGNYGNAQAAEAPANGQGLPGGTVIDGTRTWSSIGRP
jgi:hypothetical protein